MRRSPRAAGLLLGLLLLSVACAAQAGDDVRWILPAGQEEVVLGLVAPHRTQAPLEPGTWFDHIALTATGMDFVVEGREPPAGPVTIRVRWSPSTPSAAVPPEITLDIEGLDAGSPENLARSVRALHDLIDARLEGLLGPAFLGVAPEDPRGEGILNPMKAEAMVRRGITQVSWEAVGETAPEPPGARPIALLVGVLLVFGVLGILRRAKGAPGWEAVAGLLLSLGAAAAWWLTREMSVAGLEETIRSPEELTYLIPMHRDFALASFFTVGGLLGLLGIAISITLDGVRRRIPAGVAGREAVVVIGLVAGSLLLRFGVTSPNLLTDGGSGFERILSYAFGYGGTSLLVTWLLPASVEGMIWPAVAFTSALAALAPAALYALARELGIDRGPAVAAALALLCWPLHAALYTSDFLQGPILTLGLLGLWSVARAVRTDHPGGLWAGAMIYGGLIWMRPDAMIWALPYAAVASPLVVRWRTRGALWTAVGYGALTVGCRLLSYTQSPGILPEGGGNILSLTGEGFRLAGHPAFPWWLWLGIPAGIPMLWSRHRVAGLVAAGGLAAYLSLKVGGSPPDLLEFFRYLAPAMAWVSIVAGLGLAWWVDRLPVGRMRSAAAAVTVAALVATPLLHADYLGTDYAPRASDRVFRQVLAELPAGASIVVPGEDRHDGLDPSTRFRYVAWEVFDNRAEPVPGNRVLSAATLLTFLRDEARLPGYGDLDLASGDLRSGPTDWYYLRAGECLYAQGFDPVSALDPGSCAALEEALELVPVQVWAVPYRNHRLVTQPGERRPPKFDDDFRLVLYRVAGLRTAP